MFKWLAYLTDLMVTMRLSIFHQTGIDDGADDFIFTVDGIVLTGYYKDRYSQAGTLSGE